MMLNLGGYRSSLQAFQDDLPSAMVNPTVAGVSKSSRSMVAISPSNRCPEAVSAINCTFHLIPPA
jgi:hypothetical protein